MQATPLMSLISASPLRDGVRLLVRRDHHLDPPVALPARLGGLGALRARFAEGARRDPLRRRSRLDERVTHRLHPALAEREVVGVLAAWVRVAVDAHDD